MKKFAAIPLVLLGLQTTPLPGWGSKGHRTVGKVAELQLQDDHAEAVLQKIKAVLKPGETLSDVATWADTVKRVKFGQSVTDPDRDTQAFRRDLRNKGNAGWHFVDLPLDCAGYDACAAAPTNFSRQDDIVHLIEICIRTLKPSAGGPPRFGKRNALRLLVHLVGDLHQPLHVGSGYIDPDGGEGEAVIVRDPAAIAVRGLESDHGANHLLIGGESNHDLHSFWDERLVTGSSPGSSIAAFAAAVRAAFPAEGSWNGQGVPATWTRQWAGESAKVSAASAYRTVVITGPATGDDPQNAEEATKFAISLGDDYETGNQDVARLQIAKGGFRLAKLLEAIFQ
jgi:hypothetical protein